MSSLKTPLLSKSPSKNKNLSNNKHHNLITTSVYHIFHPLASKKRKGQIFELSPFTSLCISPFSFYVSLHLPP